MLSSIVRYMRCGKNRVVLRKGHIGYNLYFIYSGVVSVVLDKDEGNVFIKPEVVALRRGACFGEIALLHDGMRRTATIVCTEETEFLWVDKQDFLDKGLDQRMQEEFTFRYNFFRQWPALASWPDDEIRGLSYVSRMEEFHHNKVIVKDSAKNEWLWFIVRGSCDILRLVELDGCASFQNAVLTGRCVEQYVTGKAPRVDDGPRAQMVHSQKSLSSLDHLDNLSRSSTRDMHSSSSASEMNISTRPQSGQVLSERSQSPTTTASHSLHALRPSRMPSVIEDDEASRKGSLKLHPAAHQAGCGIYVKVDTLRDGECFGLEKMFDTGRSRGSAGGMVSLVSQGCELIHVPRTKFLEMADDATLSHIHGMLKSYPKDDGLCERFLEKSRWDAYKQEVVEKVVSEQQRSVGFLDSLRTSKRNEYLHVLEEDATLHEWLMANSNNPDAEPITAFSSVTRSATDVESAGDVPIRPKTANAKRSHRTQTSKIRPLTAGEKKELSNRAKQRPKTCPPGGRTPLVVSAGRTKSRLPAAAALGEGAHLQTTIHTTATGYRVQHAGLTARNSRGNVNLLQTVKSPSHENRMKMLRMK